MNAETSKTDQVFRAAAWFFLTLPITVGVWQWIANGPQDGLIAGMTVFAVYFSILWAFTD